MIALERTSFVQAISKLHAESSTSILPQASESVVNILASSTNCWMCNFAFLNRLARFHIFVVNVDHTRLCLYLYLEVDPPKVGELRG